MISSLVLAVSLSIGFVYAWDPPQYDHMNLIWSDNFDGPGAAPPNLGTWEVITGNLGVNQELEHYTSRPDNVQLSGGQTLQLIPQADQAAPNGWTSGRIESSYTFTPQNGRFTVAEASIRFGEGDTASKQGIWPAFWMLGDSLRHGTSWPACGELDALETVNGQLTGHGTMHCDVDPGGLCNESTGLGSSVGIPDQSWHSWRVTWDRTSGNWETETIVWAMDGQQFHQITGAQIGNHNTWAAVCHSPLYFILNVAVGGDWPGSPDATTQAGWAAMMEVAYIAVYERAG